MGSNFKKIISLLILFGFLSAQVSLAETMSGHIQHDETNKIENDKSIFTGEVETINAKDTINLTVTQTLSSGYNLEGDEFFAEVSSDVESDKGILIPAGTIVHGEISQ